VMSSENIAFLQPKFAHKIRSKYLVKKYYIFGGVESAESEVQVDLKEKVSGEISFGDLDPEEVAIHFSILDMEGLLQMRPDDLWDFHQENICQKIIQRGTKFSLWVASEIVKESNLDKRLQIYQQFLLMGIFFLEYDNFNGLMWLWLGLQSRSVERLALTRDKLQASSKEAYKTLSDICGDPKCVPLKKLAARKLEQNRVVLPWFKLLDRAVTNIEVSYNDVVLHPQGGLPLLNFEKMWVYGEQIRYFYEFHDKTHAITCKKNFSLGVLALREYLQNPPVLSEEELMNHSLVCEPATT